MGELITSKDLANRLSLSVDTIRRWARAGIIPYLKLSGKVVRFDLSDVERALRARAAREYGGSGLEPAGVGGGV